MRQTIQTSKVVLNFLKTMDLSINNTQNKQQYNSGDETYFFTGSAERVLAWNRLFKKNCYFEVIASLISIQESPENPSSTLLLRDKKGPILQLIYYHCHATTNEQFISGQILRCVGYMTGINTMVAVKVRRATNEEIASLSRFCHIGDFTISSVINEEGRK